MTTFSFATDVVSQNIEADDIECAVMLFSDNNGFYSTSLEELRDEIEEIGGWLKVTPDPMATKFQARLSNITRMVACPMILGGVESGTRRVFALGYNDGGRYIACCLAVTEDEDPRGDLRTTDGVGRWFVEYTADPYAEYAELDQTIAQYNADERWGQCVEV